MTTRVVGLGQRAAGDDGVGLVVVERLRELALPGVELVQLAEPTGLIPLLATRVPTVIVDAVVCDDASPGAVVELDGSALPHGLRAMSTHGVGLARALAWAREVAEPGGGAAVRIVGVVIDASTSHAIGLSPPVEAAVPAAIEAVAQALRRIGSAERDQHR